MNRRWSRLRLLFFMSTILLILLGCSIPERPDDWSWDTHLVVPLGVRTYGMWEMAATPQEIRDRGSGVGMNADSSLFFSGYQRLQVSFRDSLTIDPYQFDLVKPVTAILVPVNLNQTDIMSLGQLNPAIAAMHGSVQDLTPHPLSASTIISFGNGVVSMTVDTGSILLSVANTLPYEVTQMRIELDNQAGANYILMNNESVSSGGQLTRRISLQTMELQNIAQLNVTATGEGGNGILVDSTRGLTLSTVMDTIQAVPYYGIIPVQQSVADSSFEFNQQHRLYLGIIDTGSVTIYLENNTQLDDSVWIVFSNLMTQAGDTLISRQFVPAYESRNQTVNLRNYVMRLANTQPQRLSLRMLSRSLQTSGADSFEAQGQYVRYEITTTPIGFSYYEGEINNVQLQIPLLGTLIERPPQGWEAVQPTTVDGFIHVFEGIGATANTQIDLRTYLGGNSIGSSHLDAPNVFLGADTTLEYHGLANLMSQYPDYLTSSGSLVVSGPVAMYETETIDLDIELRAPLEFILHPVHAPGDVQRIETNDIADVQGGTARVRVWNRLPAGGRVYLVAGSDSVNVLPNSGALVDTVADMQIPVSAIVNGRATGEAYVDTTFTLSEYVLELFHHPPFFTRMDISMPGSGADTLIADGSDYVRVQVIADVTYRIDTGGGE